MTRKKLLMIINSAVGLLFFCVGLTGLLSEQLPEQLFQIVHQGGGKFFIIFAVAYLAMNWAWAKNTFLKSR